jgi:hypothetical protein
MFRKTGSLASIGLAATLFATTAFAQATAPAANSPAPSARQLELAHRYIQAVHMERTMDGVMKNVMPAMMAQMPKNPNMTDAQRQAIGEAAAEVTTHMMSKMMAQMEPIMAETFSEKELADLVAFYEGPTGQAVIARTPQMATRMMSVAIGQMPEMQAEMRAKICAKIDCSGKDKAAPPKPS